MQSNNLNGKSINSVIDFDMIVNTELGLIRFIKQNYQDDRVFDLDILNRSDREILSLLYGRINPNPLSIISLEENMESIDELYDSFFEKYKKEIIKLSIAEKAMIKFVGLVADNGYNFGINNYIVVRDNIEKQSMIDHFNRLKFLYRSEDSKNIASMDAFYIKDYRFFLDNNITKIAGKRIYTSSRQYNLMYFADENNSNLSVGNEFVLFGEHYRKLEVNEDE